MLQKKLACKLLFSYLNSLCLYLFFKNFQVLSSFCNLTNQPPLSFFFPWRSCVLFLKMKLSCTFQFSFGLNNRLFQLNQQPCFIYLFIAFLLALFCCLVVILDIKLDKISTSKLDLLDNSIFFFDLESNFFLVLTLAFEKQILQILQGITVLTK